MWLHVYSVGAWKGREDKRVVRVQELSVKLCKKKKKEEERVKMSTQTFIHNEVRRL